MRETDILCPPPYSNSATETVFFDFEEDFAEDNVRCIPMIVRFKLDACGIKLKLQEWSRMNLQERTLLAAMNCVSRQQLQQYRYYLQQLVKKYTGAGATDLPAIENAAWANLEEVPVVLQEKLAEFAWQLSLQQWQHLNNLQRFVLLKLCRPGHENRNFPKAVKEFGLV
jgi:hypothetical protein